MRRFIVAFTAFLALSFAPPAEAAPTFGNNGVQTNSSTAGGGPLAITTTGNASVGDTIVVIAVLNGGTTGRSVDDTGSGGSNTYTEFVTSCTFNTSNKLYIYTAPVTHALASGQTITFHWTNSVKASVVSGIGTGLNTTTPLLTMACGTAGTGTSDSVASAGSPASGVIVGSTGIAGQISAYTPGTGFTGLTGETGSNFESLQWGYDVATSATYGPSWTTSRAFGSLVATLQGASAAATGHNLLLLGVGQ